MHALALYLLPVHEPQHDGKTAGALTNTQKVVLILAAVHKDLGVRRIQVHMYALLSFLLSVCFCFFFHSYLFGMSSREKDGRGQILFMHTPRTNGRFS